MPEIDAEEEKIEQGLYEVAFHLLSTIPEGDVAGEFSKVMDIIGKHGASIKATENPALRGLSYNFEKQKDGKNIPHDSAYFGSVVFETTAEAIPEIRSAVEVLPSILRVIVIETTPEALLPRERKVSGRIEPEKFRAEKQTGTPQPISEEELDKSIEKLVTE